MTPLEKLSELGFANAAIVGEKKGIVTVRIRTTRGWTYERFNAATSAVAVEAWAVGREAG